MNGIYAVKPQFQKALRPVEASLVNANVHPDSITFSALIISVLGGTAIAFSSRADLAFLLCSTPLIAFIRTALNALDGMVAVRTGKARPWGEVLNEFCDRLSDIAIFAGIYFSKLANGPLLTGALIALLLSSYLGILSKAAGGKRQFGGVMGKADRMVLLALMGPLAYFLNENRWVSISVVFDTYCAIVLVASIVTILQRGVRTYVDLQSSSK